MFLAKEKTSVTAETEEECRAKAEAVRRGYITIEKKRSLTVRKAYEDYISAKEAVLSPSTLAGYKRLSKNTFQTLMPIPLDVVTAPQVQKAVNAMARNYSPKYVRNAYGLFTAVCSLYRPDFSPAVTLPQKEKPVHRALNEAEIIAIIEAVKGEEIELPVLCGLWLGMRMSEIIGAEVEDIHEGVLHVHRAVVLDENGNAVEKLTKTDAGDRFIPVPDYILNLLPNSGRFTDLSGQAIYKRLSRICESHGIPHCRFHDLRHANAAIMLSLGIDSATAQERNGWSSDRMYKQVYGYSQSETAAAATIKINSYFETKIKTESAGH